MPATPSNAVRVSAGHYNAYAGPEPAPSPIPAGYARIAYHVLRDGRAWGVYYRADRSHAAGGSSPAGLGIVYPTLAAACAAVAAHTPAPATPPEPAVYRVTIEHATGFHAAGPHEIRVAPNRDGTWYASGGGFGCGRDVAGSPESVIRAFMAEHGCRVVRIEPATPDADPEPVPTPATPADPAPAGLPAGVRDGFRAGGLEPVSAGVGAGTAYAIPATGNPAGGFVGAVPDGGGYAIGAFRGNPADPAAWERIGAAAWVVPAGAGIAAAWDAIRAAWGVLAAPIPTPPAEPDRGAGFGDAFADACAAAGWDASHDPGAGCWTIHAAGADPERHGTPHVMLNRDAPQPRDVPAAADPAAWESAWRAGAYTWHAGDGRSDPIGPDVFAPAGPWDRPATAADAPAAIGLVRAAWEHAWGPFDPAPAADPDACGACGEPLDSDCNGDPRCPGCDGPCPCCHDGGGPDNAFAAAVFAAAAAAGFDYGCADRAGGLPWAFVPAGDDPDETDTEIRADAAPGGYAITAVRYDPDGRTHAGPSRIVPPSIPAIVGGIVAAHAAASGPAYPFHADV